MAIIPNMTRTQFNYIARELHEARDTRLAYDLPTVDRITLQLCNALQLTNPNFNRARFLAACKSGSAKPAAQS